MKSLQDIYKEIYYKEEARLVVLENCSKEEASKLATIKAVKEAWSTFTKETHKMSTEEAYKKIEEGLEVILNRPDICLTAFKYAMVSDSLTHESLTINWQLDITTMEQLHG